MKNVTKEEKMAYVEKAMLKSDISQSLLMAWIENDREKAIEALRQTISDIRHEAIDLEATKDFIIFSMDAFVDSLDKRYFEEFKELSDQLTEDEEFINKLEELEDKIDDKLDEIG